MLFNRIVVVYIVSQLLMVILTAGVRQLQNVWGSLPSVGNFSQLWMLFKCFQKVLRSSHRNSIS